jgi:predicted transcriptional regulator
MPQRTPLEPDQKKQLALGLKDKVSAANIARLLGVTRQAVYQYFKQEE